MANNQGARSKGLTAGKSPKKAPAVGARSKGKPSASKTKRGKKAEGKKSSANVDLVQAKADFVRYFIEQDFKNATGAYMRAYSEASEATASANSSRLLRDAKVQDLISTELEAVLKERRRPLEKRILDTWTVRAFYDPTEIIDLHGRLKMSEAELRKRGLHVVIDCINKKKTSQGSTYMEYKLADRDKALDMLRQYIQMIEPPKQRLVLESISIGEPPKPADLEAQPLPSPPPPAIEPQQSKEGADA